MGWPIAPGTRLATQDMSWQMAAYSKATFQRRRGIVDLPGVPNFSQLSLSISEAQQSYAPHTANVLNRIPVHSQLVRENLIAVQDWIKAKCVYFLSGPTSNTYWTPSSLVADIGLGAFPAEPDPMRTVDWTRITEAFNRLKYIKYAPSIVRTGGDTISYATTRQNLGLEPVELWDALIADGEDASINTVGVSIVGENSGFPTFIFNGSAYRAQGTVQYAVDTPGTWVFTFTRVQGAEIVVYLSSGTEPFLFSGTGEGVDTGGTYTGVPITANGVAIETTEERTVGKVFNTGQFQSLTVEYGPVNGFPFSIIESATHPSGDYRFHHYITVGITQGWYDMSPFLDDQD